jgi:hypothetical protein
MSAAAWRALTSVRLPLASVAAERSLDIDQTLAGLVFAFVLGGFHRFTP